MTCSRSVPSWLYPNISLFQGFLRYFAAWQVESHGITLAALLPRYVLSQDLLSVILLLRMDARLSYTRNSSTRHQQVCPPVCTVPHNRPSRCWFKSRTVWVTPQGPSPPPSTGRPSSASWGTPSSCSPPSQEHPCKNYAGGGWSPRTQWR